MIYILHFNTPYKHATHYIGYTASVDSLETRIGHHLDGRGARLMNAVARAGITFELAAIFPGDRTLERKLHKQSAASPSRGIYSICPLCRYLAREKAELSKLAGLLSM
ncbi:endonuclease [Patescibacteria group bacterium]|nr:endonuclease [Patescibacteria group bacterium]